MEKVTAGSKKQQMKNRETTEKNVRRWLEKEVEGEDEGSLPLAVALVALMMLVASVDEVVGERVAGGSVNGMG